MNKCFLKNLLGLGFEECQKNRKKSMLFNANITFSICGFLIDIIKMKINIDLNMQIEC